MSVHEYKKSSSVSIFIRSALSPICSTLCHEKRKKSICLIKQIKVTIHGYFSQVFELKVYVFVVCTCVYIHDSDDIL